MHLSVVGARTLARKQVRNYSTKNNKIVVVGGGTGGISITAQLLRKGVPNCVLFSDGKGFTDITIVEPADQHFYQPGWTLVGGGLMTREETAQPMSAVIPPKSKWVQNRVTSFEPDSSHVVLADGTKLGYDVLIVAAGTSHTRQD
jgi:sulfide:quinone oxidoreductase